MRALALHNDLIVFVSGVWQTTCTAVRAGDEGFLIDSPVLPEELEALPGVLEQAGFPVSGLLATHGDWDHLLGRLAFPDAALGCAESTAHRLAMQPGAAQRELRAFDAEWYVQRSGPLSLGSVQELPVPGRLALGAGDQEIELHPAPGHTSDGAAILIPWLETLVCGDYLSPVEIPMIAAGGSAADYRQALEQLRPLVDRCTTIIPGHGAPLDRAQAQRVLGEDVAYLDALQQPGHATSLPEGRRGAAQRRIHERNLAAVAD